MPTIDPRVDAYIAAARPFAQPILAHLRAIVHEAIPEVEETIKWGMPHFVRDGIVCSCAAFTAHCAFTLWQATAVLGPEARGGAMGQYGRISRIADLPARRTLVSHVRKAAALRAAGTTSPQSRPVRRTPPIEVPADLVKALAADPVAQRTFDGFAPSHRREYVEWITEAKREATRARRIATTIAWLREGKGRNWKYER
jgi:uncharacterized protein YdeI (YjbR/CyaY-like superfamily)